MVSMPSNPEYRGHLDTGVSKPNFMYSTLLVAVKREHSWGLFCLNGCYERGQAPMVKREKTPQCATGTFGIGSSAHYIWYPLWSR